MKHPILILFLTVCCYSQELIEMSDTLIPDETAPSVESSRQETVQPQSVQKPVRQFSRQTYPQQMGALHITVKPDTASVFINGRKAGKGNLTLSDLPVGNYNVYVSTEENSEERNVSVLGNQVRKIDIRLGRHVYFNVASSFSQVWFRKTRTYGPSLDLGLKVGKQYFGLNYHWNFLGTEYDDDEFWDPDSTSKQTVTRGDLFGGAALQWYYDVFEIPGIFYLSPGFCSGFWYGNMRKYTLSDEWGYWDYMYDEGYDDFFFGGVSVRISAGYKFAFVNCAYTLLLGNSLGHSLVVGLRLIL